MLRDSVNWNLVTLLAVSVSFGVPAMQASSLPALWPTFSQPSNIINIPWMNAGQNSSDYLSIKTLQGAYNGLQGSTRLYVTASTDDTFWLRQVPSGITVSNLSYNNGDPDGILKALLNAYGSSIKGYIVCDAVNLPESCNMAKTMAGIDNAIVVTPDDLSVVSSYLSAIPGGDLRTYLWVGSNSSLVNNTSINLISNPGGGNGTTGWSTAGNGTCSGVSLSSTTYNGAPALKYSVPANQTADCWADYVVSATANRYPYVFSVQVAGTGSMFLDAWNGANDTASSTASLNSSYQTLQAATPIPLNGNNSTVKLQVRIAKGSSAVTCYFINAAVVGNRVAVDTYAYNNLISQTNATILAQDHGSPNRIDYEVAAKMFSFDLSSSNADEAALLANIIDSTPANTPVWGSPDSESNDVGFLSGLTVNGVTVSRPHWMNAQASYNNASVWASMPSPSSFSQPTPLALNVHNGTTYIGLSFSDGDDIGFVQQRQREAIRHSLFMGAVPLDWTTAPGAIQFSPGMLQWLYTILPQSAEASAGPSGIGYQRDMPSSALSTFGNYTNEFMTAEGLQSVTSWQDDSSLVSSFASDANVPHVLYFSSYSYTLDGSTVIDGQDVHYVADPDTVVSDIKALSYSSSAPNFHQVLIDGWHLSPDDVLYIAQQLQLTGGHSYVFMTSTELAAAEKAYHNGGSTVITTPYAADGTTLLNHFPQNIILNGNGVDGSAGVVGAFGLGSTGHNEVLWTSDQTFNGVGAEEFSVPGGVGTSTYVKAALTTTNGENYGFSVQVAGTGVASLLVYNGSTNYTSQSVTLSSSWQTLSLEVPMATATSGYIELVLAPESYAQTVYFQNSTPSVPLNGAWDIDAPSSTPSLPSAPATIYNYMPAWSLNVPANQGGTVSFRAHPAAVISGNSYDFAVDLAGSGQAYLHIYTGQAGGVNSSTITLGPNYQTLRLNNITVNTASGRPEIWVPAQSSAATVYIRNVFMTPHGSSGTVDFSTGLESGDRAMCCTNTVDGSPGAGGESNVSNAVLELNTSFSRAGGNSIQYSGTATGGTTSSYAYMEAFSGVGLTLSSTSRLSYWVYPETPYGAEPGASSTTGTTSTCVAVDMVFSDGTRLDSSTVTDQYGNQLHPYNECGHLVPDQWNYVTVNLSPVSGKTISTIDVGFSQTSGSGSYAGYVDDIQVTH